MFYHGFGHCSRCCLRLGRDESTGTGTERAFCRTEEGKGMTQGFTFSKNDLDAKLKVHFLCKTIAKTYFFIFSEEGGSGAILAGASYRRVIPIHHTVAGSLFMSYIEELPSLIS